MLFQLIITTILLGLCIGFTPIPRLSRATFYLNSMETEKESMELRSEEGKFIDISYEDVWDGAKPDSSWNLATENFVRQGEKIIEQGYLVSGLKEKEPCRLPDCLQLRLSNEAVKEAERVRIQNGGGVDAHPVSQLLYDVGCLVLDGLFDERPIERFWFLETIARIPYFSYISMLHLYESFGWFRGVELRKVHAAEDWNELHHLLIMESLGGNSVWSDRFLGYHVALVYYWFLNLVYFFSPRIAYQFMELLEAHAVDTYSTFVKENRQRLSMLPSPNVARSYYETGDLYMFDDFQVSRAPGDRRPPCETLLDVFENIAMDEGEHVRTMQACQDYAVDGTKVVSPHLNNPVSESSIKRRIWKEWSDSINAMPKTESEMDP